MKTKAWFPFICSILFAVIIGSLFLMAPHVQAAQAWSPKKTIAWIATVGPGGGIDTTMRGILLDWSRYLGKPIIIRNMPGAGTRLATSYTWRSKPDGYTLGQFDPVTCMGTQFLMKTEYKWEGFTHIGQVNSRFYSLAVSAKGPYRTLEDLQKAAAKRPKGKPLKIGGIGLSTANAINALLALPKLNLPFKYIGGMPGSAAAMIACIKGDLDMLFYPLESYVPYVKSGDLRPIFTCGPERNKFLPDVPTIKELGHPEIVGLGMAVVVAGPPGIPENIRSVLEDSLMKAAHDPKVQAWSQKVKVPINPLTRAELQPLVKRSYELIKNYPALLKQYEKWQKP